MNEFWIFLVIAGIIISFANKNDKRSKKGKDTKTVSPYDENPRAEIERQLRELLRKDATAHNNPQQVNYTIKPSSENINAKPKANSTTPPKPKAPHPAVASERSDNSLEDAQISKIIDDFSMEKAVIYAEILKPKYEEY